MESTVLQEITIEVTEVKAHYIRVSEDRLENCLIKNLKKAEKKYNWIAPLGILIAIITTFATATFKDIVFSSQTWEAIFIIGGITTFIWLTYNIIQHAFEKKVTMEDIISEIKKPRSEYLADAPHITSK